MSNEQQPQPIPDQPPKDTRNAVQKIQDLEASMLDVLHAMSLMTRDLQITKEAVKLLGKKTEAMTRANVRGLTMTDENVAALMTEVNAEELKEKADNFVAGGLITPSEVITDNSFVVGEELDGDKVINPRSQFVVGRMPKEVQDLLIGKKAGDVVKFGENKRDLKILEVFELAKDEAPQAPAPQQTTDGIEGQAPAPAPEAAPAQEQTPAESQPAQDVPAQDQAPAAPAADPAAGTAQ